MLACLYVTNIFDVSGFTGANQVTTKDHIQTVAEAVLSTI